MKNVNVVFGDDINDVDIIIVPDYVFNRLSDINKDFWHWLENTPDHKCWRSSDDGIKYLDVETETLIEWINTYYVQRESEIASVFLSHTTYNPEYESIEF